MPRPRRKTSYVIKATESDGSLVRWRRSRKNFRCVRTRRRAEKIAWAESGRGRTVTVERINRRYGLWLITCAWVYKPPAVIETVVKVRHFCEEGPRLVPHA